MMVPAYASTGISFTNRKVIGSYLFLPFVRPGSNVLMVGAGNIGLIVSYQLMQAGVNVKAILDLHKGDILVDSELENGSTFTIRLPLKT